MVTSMQKTTLIIGKESNLSTLLQKRISNSVLVSSREIAANNTTLDEYKNRKINIIFNNFQQSTQLNNLGNIKEYIENSIDITAKVLDTLTDATIEKIIYTSSSSVYGNNIFCNELDNSMPLNLHASLKLSNEKLVESYCLERNIDYTTTRVFNMYGHQDKFSIISKIIDCTLNKKVLTIVNNGNAIRDFIHIDDVVSIYKKLIVKRDIPLLNIGTGIGTSVKSLLDFLDSKKIILKIDNITRDELKVSTANISLLSQLLGEFSFVRVEDFLLSQLYKGEIN